MSLIDALANLPRAAARHTIFTLTQALPPPLSDLPDERAARDEAAIAAVAALHPADAFEGQLAARSVATEAWAMDCLRLAGLSILGDPEEARRCRREAALMMRASNSALRALRAMKADRARQQAEAAAMTQPEPAQDAGKAADTPPPLLQPRDSGRAPHQPTGQPPRSDLAAEADDYALHHRKRASLIRRLRRLPRHIDCGSMSPDLVHAIITGTTPILSSLDTPNGNKARLAA